MNYQEFLDTAHSVADVRFDGYYKERPYNGKNTDRAYIKESWTVGGTQGGNCWSDGGHYSVTAEPEPEFTSVDLILAKVCPTISFLQYKVLMAKIVHVEDSTENEYYGNYTKYRAKVIYLDELFNAIKDLL